MKTWPDFDMSPWTIIETLMVQEYNPCPNVGRPTEVITVYICMYPATKQYQVFWDFTNLPTNHPSTYGKGTASLGKARDYAENMLGIIAWVKDGDLVVNVQDGGSYPAVSLVGAWRKHAVKSPSPQRP